MLSGVNVIDLRINLKVNKKHRSLMGKNLMSGS